MKEKKYQNEVGLKSLSKPTHQLRLLPTSRKGEAKTG